MRNILSSAELYEIAFNETHKEDSKYKKHCVNFCLWLMSLFIDERYFFLKEIEKENFTTETWLEYITKNW